MNILISISIFTVINVFLSFVLLGILNSIKKNQSHFQKDTKKRLKLFLRENTKSTFLEILSNLIVLGYFFIDFPINVLRSLFRKKSRGLSSSIEILASSYFFFSLFLYFSNYKSLIVSGYFGWRIFFLITDYLQKILTLKDVKSVSQIRSFKRTILLYFLAISELTISFGYFYLNSGKLEGSKIEAIVGTAGIFLTQGVPEELRQGGLAILVLIQELVAILMIAVFIGHAFNLQTVNKERIFGRRIT